MSYYWTVRPHDDTCIKAKENGSTDCAPGCRAGKPWPTLELLPSDREYAAALRRESEKRLKEDPR